LTYIDYQSDAAVVKMWLEHHFNLKNLTLNLRASVESVVGVAAFVVNGAGAGVLPDHKIQKLEKEGIPLQKIKGSSSPLRNAIGVAYLSQRTHSPAALKVKDLLVSALK
jgi:DNA-binding transcriptional LysR family regulator